MGLLCCDFSASLWLDHSGVERCYALLDHESSPGPDNSDNAQSVAALVGLSSDTAESLTLLLGILGWNTTALNDSEIGRLSQFRVIFIDNDSFESLNFNVVSIDLSHKFIIFVGGSILKSSDIDNQHARYFHIATPINVAEVENIIAQC